MAETHDASTTLDDIINELKLTYDASNGLLDGDSIRSIPNVNTLTNLNKLFSNLKKQLCQLEQNDEEVLQKIEVSQGGGDDSKKRSRGVLEDIQDNDDVKKRRLDTTADGEGAPDTSEGKERLNSKDDPVPPVQSGSFSHDNDTRLKNPKSEYVEPQVLSTEAISALGLYSEDNHGLETHGKEYLKKKYGVASYPENDLQDLLPGKIPDIDFSKNKPPTNQVQFSTFQSYIESYFRPFTNEDLRFLEERNIIPPGFEKSGYDPDVSPFIIPRLGRFYADVWAEEDSTLAAKLNSPALHANQSDGYKAKGSINLLSDDKLYTEEVSCGPLSSRLLSAILSNHEVENEDDADGGKDGGAQGVKNENGTDRSSNLLAQDEVATQLNSNEDYRITTDANDYQSIEDRLKRELKYIGIFMNLPTKDDGKAKANKLTGRIPKKSSISIVDSDEWIRNKEDDEVCAEIRSLQNELREVTSRNRANKRKLIPIIQDNIAYQEYSTILEDLDKQVDSAFMKRSKGKSKKKKIDANAPQQQAVNSGLRALLEKRRRWIDSIGKLFPPPEVMKREPTESILVKEGIVDTELNDEEGDNASSNAVDLITQ
ncbi:Ngg1 protein [Candida orthopsilosis Co 90-125]|uniref:Ngg1 protein n=1 Tax=Candida orthopsilosis (strain 90-125) TaxID=1136231 RepID=H8X0G7_CANO9|nr:Ngg1 protein [Candida orthopsilosis Co 90-125]CCG22679.1 Ngg1 protein [Candida orthopsilosis Co 90-125]